MSENWNPGPVSMRGFWIIWSGQVVSQIASALSAFGLSVWVFERSASVQQFALIDFFNTLPYLFMTPIAGLLADRYDRRSLMILADAAGALRALFFVALLMAGRLNLWAIYLSCAAVEATGAISAASFTASLALIVPEKQLGRANGMVQLTVAVSQIAAPPIAAVLLKAYQLQGIMLVDFVSFLISIGAFLMVKVPDPRGNTGPVAPTSFAQETKFAWNYLNKRSALLHLLAFYALINFLVSIVVVVYRPMILTFASPQGLGFVIAAVGAGMAAGSAAMAVWGGPRDMVKGIVGSMLLGGCSLIAAGAHASVLLVAITGFCFSFGTATLTGCLQSVLQKRVDVAVQGRVFGLVMLIISAAAPVGQVLAGPLCDRIFEPLLRTGGSLGGSIGQIIGTGPGRGMGLLIMLLGCVFVVGAAIAYRDAALTALDKPMQAEANTNIGSVS